MKMENDPEFRNILGRLEVLDVPFGDLKTNDELRRSLLAASSAIAAKRVVRLQIQCVDNTVLDITHEEALMSTRLWMLRQDILTHNGQKSHILPILDVPSASVKLALYYCRYDDS